MSTRAAAKNKTKKPLQTTLGKAPRAVSNDRVDLSHVGKTIHTSLFGLKPVLALFQTATEEVRSYITYECDIMYECRICRTIFRSLANFVLHKRNYCQESYNRRNHTTPHPTFSETDLLIMQDEVLEESNSSNKEEEDENRSSDSNSKVKKVDDSDVVDTKILRSKKGLCSILPRLVDKQQSALITEECLAEDNSNESEVFNNNKEIKNNIALQNINNSMSGVFQTMLESKQNKLDFMKTEVMEIHDILENNEAIIGPNGKIVAPEGEKNSTLKNNFLCNVCNQKFSTKKTLTYHINYKHNSTRQIYQCTECTDTFANTWGVFRHLYKTHRKTPAQVKKLRSQIHCNKIRNDEQVVKVKSSDAKPTCALSTKTQEKSEVEEQQWIDDLERDNDLQRCGGCGRKFERKAALHSHSQFCTKRIALCNSIKENTTKRVQEEKHDPTNKVKVFQCEQNSANGSRRRKPLVAHKILRFDYTKDKCDTPIITDDFTNKQFVQLLPEKSIEKDDAYINNTEVSEELTNTVHVDKTEDSNETAKDRGVSTTEVVNPEKVIYEEETKIPEIPCVIEDKNVDVNNSSTAKPELMEENPNETLLMVENNSTVIKNGNDLDNDETIVGISKIEKVTSDSLTSSFVPVGNLNEDLNQNISLIVESTTTPIETVINALPGSSDIKRKLEDDSSDLPLSIKRKCRQSHTTLYQKSINYIDKDKNECLSCNTTYKSFKLLLKHMAVHFNWHRYQCQTCQFLSYQRCKCEHHVARKHSIADKNVINSLIVRIPSTKTIELSTDFTEICKSVVTTFPACEKVEVPTPVPDISMQQDDNTKTEHVNELNLTQEGNAEDATADDASTTPNTKVREMIMEVIFGSNPVSTASDPNKEIAESSEIIEEKPKDTVVDQTTTIKSTVSDVIKDTCDVNEKLMKDSNFAVKETVRPVRNRTATVRKDFLYDMTQILKLKPNKAKESGLDSTLKQKPVKIYAKKTKLAAGQHKSISNNKNFKIIEDVNMNNKTVQLAKI